MAREKEPDMPDEVPTWLMTFSDVITLLMTFFILLLTFATNEPESFEKMQVSMFQGGGSAGIAGDADTAQDRDSVILRERPKAGRVTTRGSEMPPIQSDASTSSLSKGIAGLREDEQREMSTNHALVLPMDFFFDANGDISAKGEVSARMLARQMHNQPLDIRFSVSSREDLGKAQRLASHLFEDFSVQPGRIGVGLNRSPQRVPSSLEVRLTLVLDEQGNGP
jgi:flagellar motor protein MotB